MVALYHTSKTCTICQLEKPLSEFHKYSDSTVQSGYSYKSFCKVCRNQRDKERRNGTAVPLKKPLNVSAKVCRTCTLEKPLEDFYTSVTGKHGRASHCKECMRERYKSNPSTYHARHKEERHAYNKDYRLTHPKRHIVRPSAEHERDRNQRSYERHSEKRKAKVRAWSKANPLKTAEMRDRRRARKRNATIGKVSYKCILEQSDKWCYICEKAIEAHHKIHFDHVIPLERGGSHSEDNIKITHSTCNLRKNRRLLEEMTPYMRRGVA